MRVSSGDRGQAGVLVLIVTTVLFVSLAAGTVGLGARLIDRTRAQTAADAAALAALQGGRTSAEVLAQRHGATLVSVTRGPVAGAVTVVVRLGTATASAAATDRP